MKKLDILDVIPLVFVFAFCITLAAVAYTTNDDSEKETWVAKCVIANQDAVNAKDICVSLHKLGMTSNYRTGE